MNGIENIAIVGVGQTKIERNKKGETFADMVYEATHKALSDAGMTMDDIDNVITTSNDFWDGRTISTMAVNDACGAGLGKNMSAVEGDGAFSAFYGMTRVLSETYKTSLVVSHVKGSESDNIHITNGIFDPIYMRPVGLDSLNSAALQMRRYMLKYGITEEQCALVSVKNHKNALNNPNAQLPLEISVEDVLESRLISDPLKLYDCSPISDAAAAVIIAGGDAAKKAKKPVWVKAVAYASDAYFLGDRDLADAYALDLAASRAYEMAGITDPVKELDVAELYDAFSYMELMWYEALGFCPPGGGGKFIDKGITQMDGELPVNPSGGLLSGHPVIVGGMIRLAEAVLQVRGDAGDRQVPGVKTALAHGVNGVCGQSHCVWIVGR
jgi:acetyl-CoA C-acetyltransferase